MGFELPLIVDLAGVFFFALTGALAAVRKGYDVVGLFALALATGLGGGVLRDVLLAAGTPAALHEPRFLAAAGAAGLLGWILGARIDRFRASFEMLDALGLGVYAVVGAQKALRLGLSATSAALLGGITAVGGGLLRDVLTREEPLIFRPGHVYALAALAGSGSFVALTRLGGAGAWPAVAGVALAVSLRALSLRLGWKTGPVARP